MVFPPGATRAHKIDEVRQVILVLRVFRCDLAQRIEQPSSSKTEIPALISVMACSPALRPRS